MSQVWVECGGLDLFSICVLFPYDIIVFPNLYAQYIALCVVSTLYYYYITVNACVVNICRVE